MEKKEKLAVLQKMEKRILQAEIDCLMQEQAKEQLFASMLYMKVLLYAQDGDPKWIKDVLVKKADSEGYYGI